jgi:hypothetical protein
VIFETRSHYVDYACLKFAIFLLKLPKHWDYRCVPLAWLLKSCWLKFLAYSDLLNFHLLSIFLYHSLAQETHYIELSCFLWILLAIIIFQIFCVFDYFSNFEEYYLGIYSVGTFLICYFFSWIRLSLVVLSGGKSQK